MKEERINAIRKLLSKKQVKTQAELLHELRALGFKTTQATISRDLEELGLFKDRRSRVYKLAAKEPEENSILRLQRGVADYVSSVEVAGNLIVVKTIPGGAQGVASALDQMSWTEVVGTVAGDDTILVIASDRAAAGRITQRLKRMKEKK